MKKMYKLVISAMLISMFILIGCSGTTSISGGNGNNAGKSVYKELVELQKDCNEIYDCMYAAYDFYFNTRAMYGEYGTNTESEFAKRTGLPLTAVKRAVDSLIDNLSKYDSKIKKSDNNHRMSQVTDVYSQKEVIDYCYNDSGKYSKIEKKLSEIEENISKCQGDEQSKLQVIKDALDSYFTEMKDAKNVDGPTMKSINNSKKEVTNLNESSEMLFTN